jgi:branched-chain amino acid transport system substrate-binding protein/urea transport system substrate-binding protein
MADTIHRFEVPLLYATDYEGGGCDPHMFFFNTVPNQSVTPLVRYMHDHIGARYYMLGADYIWPRRMFEATRAVIDERGDEVLGERLVPLGAVEDYSSIIKEILASGADILVFALPGADGVAFIGQAAGLGLWRQLTMAFFGDSATYLGALGRGEGEGQGLYACVPFVERDPSPGVQDFVRRIRARHGAGTVISSYVMTHYNALIALKEGLEKAGEVSRAAAAAGLAGLTYRIPTGESQITSEDHHSALSMYITRIENGSLRLVEPLGRIEPVRPCA